MRMADEEISGVISPGWFTERIESSSNPSIIGIF
jgi:hypothetical protein